MRKRLKSLHLTTLETRRLRGDLIEVFKILRNMEGTDSDLYFKLSSTGLRGHSLKLYKQEARLDVRKYFFSHRVVDIWNALPEWVIGSNNVENFKIKLDLYLHNRGYL